MKYQITLQSQNDKRMAKNNTQSQYDHPLINFPLLSLL